MGDSWFLIATSAMLFIQLLIIMLQCWFHISCWDWSVSFWHKFPNLFNSKFRFHFSPPFFTIVIYPHSMPIIYALTTSERYLPFCFGVISNLSARLNNLQKNRPHLYSWFFIVNLNFWLKLGEPGMVTRFYSPNYFCVISYFHRVIVFKTLYFWVAQLLTYYEISQQWPPYAEIWRNYLLL